MTRQAQWRPSRNEQRMQWWAKQILCYIIGGGGLTFEVVGDHLRNPTALVVFGGIAGITDVLGYRQMVRQQAEADNNDQDE